MRENSIAVAIILFSILGIYVGYCLIVQASTDKIEYTEMEIVDVENTVSGEGRSDFTILTIYKENGEKYTLPSIATRHVREYPEGDMIPVSVTYYHDGTYIIKVDLDRLNSNRQKVTQTQRD